MTTQAPTTRLMLVTPPVADAEAMAFRLMQAMAGGDIAAILLKLAPGDDRSRIERVKRLAGPVQGNGVALVVEDNAMVAARGGADGVHLTGGPAAVAEARSSLKGERIIGAGGLRARHDAMDVGEAGVDYVMFGEPRADGSIPPLSAVVERAGWWAEIFETPCVAYAPDAESVAALVETGAEFVALGEWAFAEGQDIRALVEAANASIGAWTARKAAR
ncbi:MULTISPECIES: thiamine phosphate synthase [unclassified Bosea (in: a-proteobacteria)]|uniref:thiamine phosphate synthase n=1 Tax=unclassified Bosea (in: a-proteobacteria) TaxID=2653178 RepID=UPI00095556FD|nr:MULTISPECIES: thiamine phosphate synthase [unclassified Bosea (in: a-proteobacteria)]TAJ34768.1 MAG: thiamine phosphate synthase [Bosea sp. (in: a-proteobacteria)]SIQ64431.1 thiamine-phosphate pyrophosphorylase [Bosea sp. TND4EK4]